MNDNQTCGKGLAGRSLLTAKLSDLIASLVTILESHVPTIDVDDPNGRLEQDAYVTLSNEYRNIADALRTTAEKMAGYRSLPMARHIPEKISDPKLVQDFQDFVAVEEETLAQLRSFVDRDRQMLDAMTGD